MKRKSVDELCNIFKKVKITVFRINKRKLFENEDKPNKKRKIVSRKRKADFDFYKYTKKLKMSENSFNPVFPVDEDFQDEYPEEPPNQPLENMVEPLSEHLPYVEHLIADFMADVHPQNNAQPPLNFVEADDDDFEGLENINHPEDEFEYYDDSKYLTQPQESKTLTRSNFYNLRPTIKTTQKFTPLTAFDLKNNEYEDLTASDSSSMSVSDSSCEVGSSSSCSEPSEENDGVDTTLLTQYKELCQMTGREIEPLDIVDNDSLKSSLRCLKKALKTEHKIEIATEEEALLQDINNGYGSDD